MSNKLSGILRAAALSGTVLSVASSASAEGWRDLPATARGCEDEVVVVDIPFCTDECGQQLRSQRTAAVRAAFERADANGDGHTYAWSAGYTSQIASDGYNQALSERRARYAAGLAANFGAEVQVIAGYGETQARGTEFANFDEDRYARLFMTDIRTDMQVNPDGSIQPRPGAKVVGFKAPECNR